MRFLPELPWLIESLFMHFDPFLSALEQKDMRLPNKNLLSYPVDLNIALLSQGDGAPLVYGRPLRVIETIVCYIMVVMVIPVVEFSRDGYKIRKVFG